MQALKILLIYIAVINIVDFICFGVDKGRAKRNRWRISEGSLFSLAIFGGSIGALLGMYIFRHKTKQKKYTITVPVILIIQIAAAVLLLSGCGTSGYKQISQEEAMQMMKDESGYLIVDVRRPDEFSESHIAGAINVPNETIEDEMPEALPDKEQVLLVYCRTGRRSKEASQKLADMGYTNVYEFGGIETWEGDTETGE